MRRLEQTVESLKLDLKHASRIRERASQNERRPAKANKKLIEALSVVIGILEHDAYGNGARATTARGLGQSPRNGART